VPNEINFELEKISFKVFHLSSQKTT
jgi:hypothetical protein